jgi:hypothetical protein
MRVDSVEHQPMMTISKKSPDSQFLSSQNLKNKLGEKQQPLEMPPLLRPLLLQQLQQ